MRVIDREAFYKLGKWVSSLFLPVIIWYSTCVVSGDTSPIDHWESHDAHPRILLRFFRIRRLPLAKMEKSTHISVSSVLSPIASVMVEYCSGSRGLALLLILQRKGSRPKWAQTFR